MLFERRFTTPRPNWKESLNSVGASYATFDGEFYWNESNYYSLDLEMVEKIEKATQELHDICMDTVFKLVDRGDIQKYYPYLTQMEIELIDKSWRYGHPHLYGRFDLGITRDHQIKMFEYNADTPTCLLEASVLQWNWKEDKFSHSDQFNSIHEALVAWWKTHPAPRTFFTTNASAPYEDWATVHYLMETASEAGLDVSSIDLETIGHIPEYGFVDANNNPIYRLFKLCPWEWMTQDAFAQYIMESKTAMLEPPWKMLLSTKALCATLWSFYPNHPNLLESYYNDTNVVNVIANRKQMVKPIHGREGQGIYEYDGKFRITDKPGPEIVQEKLESISFDGMVPVIGSWVVNNTPRGIGIREDTGITTNASSFVPHVFN